MRLDAHLEDRAWPNDRYDAYSFQKIGDRTFRTLTLSKTKGPDELRVLVLGDSFTWGYLIEKTTETWPFVLEDELRRDDAGIQVISLAHPGDTTVNELEYLREYGWALDPDLVIVQYLANDPLPSGPGFERVGGEWMQEESIPLALNSSLHSWLNSRSYFYAVLNDAWQGSWRRALGLRNLDYFAIHEERFEPWQDAKRALLTMVAEANARSVPIVFMMFPIFCKGCDLAEDFRYAPIHEKLSGVFELEEAEFIDLWPHYAEANPNSDDWGIRSWDEHPSVPAHRLAGQAVAEFLRSRGVLARANGHAKRPVVTETAAP